MNLKQLKELKQVKAVRVDNNFISNDDKIKNFENEAQKLGFKIVNKSLSSNLVEYELLNPDCEAVYKYYIGNNADTNKSNRIKDIIQEIKDEGMTILKTETKDNFLHVTTKENKVFHSMLLKNDYLKKEMLGLIVFRSKDYIFKFIDDNQNERTIYGDALKANMIKENKIIISDGIYYALEI